jgi:hypothetical protein
MDGFLPSTSLSHYRIVSKIGAGGMDEVYPLRAGSKSDLGSEPSEIL